MIFDDMEDTNKGPFCKPFGQLYYDNLEKMPSFQVIQAYISCLLDAQDKIQKAIAILEGALKKGSDRLKEVDAPAEIQFFFGKIVGLRGVIEEEMEKLTKSRRLIDELIAGYSEKGVYCVSLKEFMTAFDAEYNVKVEKKNADTDELYYVDIKATDLAGCTGFDHLNKIMTGYLLKKLINKGEDKKSQ
jgi:hypothetical protein